MIGMAKKVIVVTDSRKFLRRRFAFIAPIPKIHVVITDSGISEEDKARLKNHGIEVIIA
jgi:DeoR/GlpR family transcriptional regulator of sugar metabolism